MSSPSTSFNKKDNPEQTWPQLNVLDTILQFRFFFPRWLLCCVNLITNQGADSYKWRKLLCITIISLYMEKKWLEETIHLWMSQCENSFLAAATVKFRSCCRPIATIEVMADKGRWETIFSFQKKASLSCQTLLYNSKIKTLRKHFCLGLKI